MKRIVPLSLLCLCAAVLLFSCAPAADGQDMRLRKKLIATGWDQADSKRLLENLAEMEKRPFDGVVIALVGKPGERYVVRAVRKLQGKGDASIRVRWQTATGSWIAESLDQMIFCDGPADRWSELFGAVEVPEGAGRLVVLLGARGQTSPNDVAWYDDVELHKLP